MPRSIDGNLFVFYGSKKTKREANKEAAHQRKIKRYARVIYNKSTKRWDIYIRSKSLW